LNLINTCASSLDSETKKEISKILDELGDQKPEILNVCMRGILMVNTVIEPSKIIDYVKNKMIEEPLVNPILLKNNSNSNDNRNGDR